MSNLADQTAGTARGQAGLVRTDPETAARCFGMGPISMHRAVQAKVFLGFVDGAPADRWVEYDPSWSRVEAWRAYCRRGFHFEDESEVVLVVEMKAMLGVQDQLWDDGFLQALWDVRGGRALKSLEANKVLRGPAEVKKDARGRYARLGGSVAQTITYFPPVDLEELLASSPEVFASLPGTCRDPDRGVIFERPDPEWIAQVSAMPDCHARWVATLAILAHPTHGGLSRRVPRLLSLLRAIAAQAGGGLLSDARLMAHVMRALIEAAAEGPPTVALIRNYLELRDLVSVYLEWQAPSEEDEDGRFLNDLLPAELPDDLKAVFGAELDRVSVEALRRRALSAGEVTRRARQRVVCLEARLRQWSRLTDVAEEWMERIREAWRQGREPRLPLRISDTYRVVRPDGSLASDLRQTVSLEIVTEKGAWVDIAKASGWPGDVKQYLDAGTLATAPNARAVSSRWGSGERRDGRYYEAGSERRLFVRYVDTRPAGNPLDEHHEPYLVSLARVSALSPSVHLSPEKVKARTEMVDRLGLSRVAAAMSGLTSFVRDRDNALVNFALRYVGQIVLPMKEYRLLLAYGSIVARLELFSGMRIGETMQARHGGAFKERDLQGRQVACMRGRPKGFRRDRLWVIDRYSMELIQATKGWVVEMWFADIGVLPIVDYGVPSKNRDEMQCPPARYLLQIMGHAASSHELNLCLRIATLGLPHAYAHDYRYAFAKLMRIRKATRRQRALAMSHAEGSASVERYGDWECEEFDEAGAVVARLQDDLDREVLEMFIDDHRLAA